MCVHVRLQWHSGWASVHFMLGVRQTNVVLLHEAALGLQSAWFLHFRCFFLYMSIQRLYISGGLKISK